MLTYVIHGTECADRLPYVNQLIQYARASVWPATMLADGREGCRQSHLRLHQSVNYATDLLVFEDDCEIVSADFLTPMQHSADHDIVYIGVAASFPDAPLIKSVGSHAAWYSAKAIARLADYISTAKGAWRNPNGSPRTTPPPLDWLWCYAERDCGLRAWRPAEPNRYVRQAAGLPSYTKINFQR